MERLARVIDGISRWTGQIAAFMILFLIVLVVFEVVARYAFNRPTLWAHETSTMIFGAFFMLGGAYTLYLRGHVNVDVIYGKFRPRIKAALDIATSSLFFLFVVFLLLKGIDFALPSIIKQETSYTVWAPPLYPLKAVIPVAAALLILQGVAKLVRDILILLRGEVKA